jgi:hypothetical protein
VHRDLPFNRAEVSGAEVGGVPAGNKIIRRNIDTSDPRIDAFRGGEQPPATAFQAPIPRHEGPPQRPPSTESRPPEMARPVVQPPARETHEPERAAHMPESIPQSQPSHNEAFGNRGPFEPQAASQRGQASRSEMAQPAPRHENAAPAPAPRHESPAPAPRHESPAPAVRDR